MHRKLVSWYLNSCAVLLTLGCWPGIGRGQVGAENGGANQLKSALITFSGVYSIGEPLVQRVIPQTYQPLLSDSPDPKHPDGANLGVNIYWGQVNAANNKVNKGVSDHTGDSGLSKASPGGAVGFSGKPFTISFDKPVEIPSFFWTLYNKADLGVAGTISVFKQATDTTPLETILVSYSNSKGYVWSEAGFPGLLITKIAFNPADGMTMNIDDITVRFKEDSQP